jgi:hypothetical protein
MGMTEDAPVPVFTGAELALADTVILLMKVMAMHRIIDPQAINAVFEDLEARYHGQNFHSAAGMAEYLRHHVVDADLELTLRTSLDRPPEGSA